MGHFTFAGFWMATIASFISPYLSIYDFGSIFSLDYSLDISLTEINWFYSVPPKISPYVVDSGRDVGTFVPSNMRLMLTCFSLLNFSIY